jgi:integrase
MIFEDIIGAYLAARRSERGESERDRYSFARLEPWFRGRYISDLKRADIRVYINHRQLEGVKLSTIRRELRLFCAAINFVKTEFNLDSLPNPVSKLGLKADESRVRWITHQEAMRLIAEAKRCRRPHLAVFIRLALNTGCRRGELLKLNWRRVDMVNRVILLEACHTKTRKRRSVPLNDDAMDALNCIRTWQLDHGIVSDFVFAWQCGVIRSFQTSWERCLKRAGIENFRIHDLRHTFASWLVMQGESIYVVRDLLGHASITQTEIYAHLSPDQGRSAVHRLFLRRGG